jgi:hypothetical protein
LGEKGGIVVLAVKGIYKKGKVELLEPIEGVLSADLFIVVVPKEGDAADAGEPVDRGYAVSGAAFEELGLAGFFDTEEDAEVDWEEAFGLKGR